MNKVLGLLNKKSGGLHHAAFLLALASIGAKLLAILRDRLLASNFGAGESLDIYYASFRLPDLLYVFSLLFISVTALIPVLLEEKQKSLEESRQLINSAFSLFFIFIVLILVLSFFILPYLVCFIAPGFSGDQAQLFIKISRILLLSPFFLGLSNLVSSVVQSHGRFLVYALSGVLYNFGIILGLVFLYPKFGLAGVAWGVIIGSLLHLFIQVPVLFGLGYFPRFTFHIAFSKIKKVVLLSFSRTAGLTVNQLVLMALTAIASFLAAGSISVFNLASNLQSIPVGIIGLSYSMAAFPLLARKFIQQDKESFISSVVSSFNHILFWILPFSALFIVLRAQIVRVILGAGAFNWADTKLTAASLALFSVSLFAQGLILLLARAFYAAGKTKLPFLINVFSSLFIIISAFFFLLILKNFEAARAMFEKFMRVSDVSGSSVLILSLAYSLGSVLNFVLLFYFFKKDFGGILPKIKKSFFQISLVSVVVGLSAYGFLNLFAGFFNLNTFLGVLGQGGFAGLCSFIFGLLFLKAIKNEELKEIRDSLKKRLYKGLVSEPESIILP